MPPSKQRIEQLFRMWLDKKASLADSKELLELVESENAEHLLKESLLKYWEENKQNPLTNSSQTEERIQFILANYPARKEEREEINIVGTEQLTRDKEEYSIAKPVHRVHFLKTAWFRYAAAIIILFGIGAYLWNIQQKEKPLITETKPVPVKNDIMPGSDRAVLTLSNGEKVQLNDAGSETIKDGGFAIENVNGTLKYSSAASSSDMPRGARPKSSDETAASNTMTTPKGGQYQLTLADGTKVWLNASSSITYPVAFNGKTREVSITGEAYFEVKKNPSKPFIVKTYKDEINVLGTHFNVNAYPDEPFMKTSLLEGSIKIAEKILKPGQAYTNGKVIATNTEQDIAWKNGLFNFEDADLTAVLRQLQRWYDIEVKYTGRVEPRVFSGEIRKDLSLMQITNMLKDMGVQFRLEGRTLFVE